MNIGEVARKVGLPAKTIRYYEDVRLVPAPGRRASNYRQYGEQDVHRLRFVARARELGFSVAEVRRLLALYEDEHRASAEVKGLVLDHVAEIERKIADLHAMRRALLDLAGRCHGDDRPDCPILDDLAGALDGTGDRAEDGASAAPMERLRGSRGPSSDRPYAAGPAFRGDGESALK